MGSKVVVIIEVCGSENVAERIEEKSRFKIVVEAPKEAGGAIIFTFTPEKVHPERTAKGVKRRPPQYSVVVTGSGEMMSFDWSDSPDDPGVLQEDIQIEISEHIRERDLWSAGVSELVNRVERWVVELGWMVRRIQKKIDDARIGRIEVEALLIQKESFQLLLEPIGRSSEGEGLVDLYLMPAYDDIARIHSEGDTWMVRYVFAEDGTSRVGEETLPLTKGVMERVLEGILKHAASV